MPDDETAPNVDEGHTLSPWNRDALNRAAMLLNDEVPTETLNE